jgi:hypothetical protein
MKKIEIQRDPFSRATLVRAVVPSACRSSCCHCGRDGARFCYSWESDGIRSPFPRTFSRAFCGIGCFRTYYAHFIGR